MENDNEFNIHNFLQDIDWWFSKTNNSEYFNNYLVQYNIQINIITYKYELSLKLFYRETHWKKKILTYKLINKRKSAC